MRKTLIILGTLLVTLLLVLGACAPAAESPPAESTPEPTPAPTPAKFEVVYLDIKPLEITPGETVSVTAVVKNSGGSEGTYTAVLTLDGATVETREVALMPGSSKAVTFSLAKDTPGTYGISIGEQSSSLVVKEKESIFLAKISSIPDYMQTDPAYGGFPGGGTTYCGPVSVSNSLMWLSDNGFLNLTPNSGDRKKDQFDVACLLGSSAYMNTSLTDGTNPDRLCKGLKKYILERGYTYKRLEFQGWRYVDVEFRTGVDVPNLEWVKLGIKGYGSVWLNIGWYTYNSGTDEYMRIDGHWITLVGFGHDGNSPNPDYLIAHDPASRGATFANEYILPVRINSGILKGSYTGLPRSAIGFYKMMGGMHISSKADFGILDGVVVLEMKH